MEYKYYSKEEDFAFDKSGGISEFFRPIIGYDNISDFMKIAKKTVKNWVKDDMLMWGLAWYTGKRITTTPYLINVYYHLKSVECYKRRKRGVRGHKNYFTLRKRISDCLKTEKQNE